MNVANQAYEFAVDAGLLIADAREVAAASGSTSFGPVHLLAAALRADGIAAARLRHVLCDGQAKAITIAVGAAGSVRHIPTDDVEADGDIAIILNLAEHRAVRYGADCVDAADIIWALTAVLGPHSILFAGAERHVRSAVDEAPAPAEPNTRARIHPLTRHIRSIGRGAAIVWRDFNSSAFWMIWKAFNKNLSAGAVILIAGAGMIVHHAVVTLAGLLLGFKVSFHEWTEHVGGRLVPSRCLSLREAVTVTLLTRLLMAVLATSIFAVAFLELKGVGISPWPSASANPAGAFGPRDELDASIMAHLVTGPRAIELWIALGAGFMAVPSLGEVDLAFANLASGSRCARMIAILILPMRGLAWLLARFDAFTSPLGFPTMLSSGVVGVLSTFLGGYALAELAIAFAA